MFKVKYCHKVFAITEVRAYVLELFYLVSTLHNYVNIKLRSKPEAAKLFRGYLIVVTVT